MSKFSHDNSPTAAEMGSRGGEARAKALSAKRRKEIAIRASIAAARVRTAKAEARKDKAKQPAP